METSSEAEDAHQSEPPAPRPRPHRKKRRGSAVGSVLPTATLEAALTAHDKKEEEEEDERTVGSGTSQETAVHALRKLMEK